MTISWFKATGTAQGNPVEVSKTNPLPTTNAGAGYPSTPVSARSGVTAADVIAAPGTVTCTKQAGGGLTANTYNGKVVAVNAYGRTTATAGNVAVTTETTNLTMRLAFVAVTGATHYDIYVSTDADPKWVGRITEAQRGTGIKLTAVNTTGAGSIAGAVDVEAVGTGLQAATTAAVNTAYVPAAGFDATGHEYADLDLTFTRTGDAALLACTLAVMLYNSRTTTWSTYSTHVLAFGGVAGVYDSVKQRLRVTVRGNESVFIAVQSIAGTGASLQIDYTLV